MHTSNASLLIGSTVFIEINSPLYNMEALPGVLGNSSMQKGHLFQGNNGQILRGTREQKQYWRTGNIRIFFSIFEDQGNNPLYFRGTREKVPPPPTLGGPQHA